MKWDELPDKYTWDQKLAYFLNPANQDDISKEDLQDALAVLSARYCDEFYSLRFLECFVEEELGSERLDQIIESNIDSDSVTDRYMQVLEEDSVAGRLETAFGFVNDVSDDYGDFPDEDF